MGELLSDIAPAGEALAFDVAGRFLGAPLNEAPTDVMKMDCSAENGLCLIGGSENARRFYAA